MTAWDEGEGAKLRQRAIRAVQRNPSPHMYVGYCRIRAERAIVALCEAVVTTGVDAHLLEHLRALVPCLAVPERQQVVNVDVVGAIGGLMFKGIDPAHGVVVASGSWDAPL